MIGETKFGFTKTIESFYQKWFDWNLNFQWKLNSSHNHFSFTQMESMREYFCAFVVLKHECEFKESELYRMQRRFRQNSIWR